MNAPAGFVRRRNDVSETISKRGFKGTLLIQDSLRRSDMFIARKDVNG
jgi:hypothetical protein